MNIRRCNKCKKNLSVEKFYKRGGLKRGVQYSCKDCCGKHQKENKEKHNAWVRAWRMRNPERERKRIYEWRKTDAGYFSCTKTRHGENVKFTKEEFIKWNKEQVRKCYYCEISEELAKKIGFLAGENKHRLTLDRKNNRLPYTLDNIVLACWICNKCKADIFRSDEWKDIAMKYIKPRWEKKEQDG